MPLRYEPDVVVKKFNDFMTMNKENPTKDQLKLWIEENFFEAGKEFVEWTPLDWKSNPKILTNILDSHYKQWITELNEFWPQLGRKMIDDVKVN